MRRPHSGEEACISKARFTPEGVDVDATGIRHEGHASYPGKSADLPPKLCEPRVCYRRCEASGWNGR